MTMFDLIDSLQGVLDTYIESFMTSILPTASAVAAIIASIFIAVKVFKLFVSGSERIEPSSLIRPCLTLGAIAGYDMLLEVLVENPIEGITNRICAAAGYTDIYDSAFVNAVRDVVSHAQTTGGVDGGGIMDLLQVNPFLELLHLIIFLAATSAAACVVFKQLIVKAMYFIIGPFALALSLIPGNEQVANKWFQSYLGVLLWMPVLAIVQSIIVQLNITNEELDGADIIFSVVVQIVMIMTILQVPKYAEILVAQGSGMGGNVGNRLTQAGGAAAGKAYSAMTKKKS